MQIRNLIILSALMFGVLALAGCDDNSGGITQAQQDAIKNKTGPTGTAAKPSKEDMDKMQQSISNYREQHKNDKVEFK